MLLISSIKVARIFCTSCFDVSFFTFPSSFVNVAENTVPAKSSCTDIFQLSSGVNAWISLSLSTMSFTATDCTRHAERPFRIFFQSTGETLYPTSLSRSLRACCASTRSISIVRGVSMALSIADFVIS